LRRRKVSESIERFTHKDDAELGQLRSRLVRWAADNEDALRDARPTMPDTFDNRRGDNWRVMLAIADLAGEDWGDQGRLAAVKIEGQADTRTDGGRALTDARTIFYPNRDDAKDDDGQVLEPLEPLEPLERLSSADLVEKLAAYADSPWAEYGKSRRPISQAQLARLLKPFGIAPQLIRLSSGGVMRGYLRAHFEDAWERYL
jgi:hypothetical protein